MTAALFRFRLSAPFSLPLTRLLSCLILAAVTIMPGCGGVSGGGSGGRGSSSDGTRPAVQLFTPLTEAKVVTISPKEAESLALKMDRRAQGLRSWKDLDFAGGRRDPCAHRAARQ